MNNIFHTLCLFLKPVPANAGFETITIVASEAARTIALIVTLHLEVLLIWVLST
jgi:hypothetical protein